MNEIYILIKGNIYENNEEKIIAFNDLLKAFGFLKSSVYSTSKRKINNNFYFDNHFIDSENYYRIEKIELR